MKISYDWLKRYIPDLSASPEELEEVLPMLGFEVNSVDYTGVPPMPKVLVGEVVKKDQHPDADRLSVCEVNVGKESPLQIVCGATNFKEGDRVPVATVGAVLPGNFKIKKSKLRGVKSMGMMCSPTELGLGAEGEGLMILEDKPEVGLCINELYPDSTAVFHLELTANRGDCASHIGIARELAAYYKLSIKEQEVDNYELTAADNKNSILNKTEINTKNCPYYTAWVIKGVKIGPSPDWLVKEIEGAGLRSVNNVVDITNWILMDTGQPLHAFDLGKIEDKSLIVRQARDGEKLKTLDEKERVLDASMMVIADTKKPLVIAGIMGSLDAEVDNSTTDIVLESAYFNPSNIKKTSRALNLHTDSSYRFSRNIDPEMINIAAQRAVKMILDNAGGELVSPAIAVGQVPREARHVLLDPDFVRKTLGFEMEDGQILNSLLSLGFHVDPDTAPWNVTIPTFRADIERPIDLVEEVLRLHGTKNIPESPLSVRVPRRNDSPVAIFKHKAADYLVGQHFYETYHYSLRSSKEVESLFGQEVHDALRLENPLTADHTHYRPSLIPGLLEALRHNHANHVQSPRLFEIGHTLNIIEGRPHEVLSVGLVLETENTESSWLNREKPDFYTVKNLLLQLASVANLELDRDFLLKDDTCLWQAGHSASWGRLAEGAYEAHLGLLNVKHTHSLDLPYPVLAVELHILPEFFKKRAKFSRYESFSTFPPSCKDLALIVDDSIPAEEVRRNIEHWAQNAAGEGVYVEGVAVFDVYRGEGLDEEKKSLGFSITYRAQDRTLKEKEIKEAFEGLQEHVSTDGRFSVRS